MTIKSSGKLKFSDIENEFGQSKSQYGRSMSNYRRKHVYGDMELPLDSGIPTSGSISFSDFYSTELNVIVDAYSGGTVYQINAKTLWENTRTNVGDSRLTKSASAIKNCKNVIVHVNKPIGSVREDQIEGQDQVAFRTGNWDAGTNLKIYVGGQGLIAGGGGNGAYGGMYAAGATSYARGGHDNRKMNASYLGRGNGSSGLGIDYIPTEVTVMASNHPLRKTSGTPGAIVGGCAAGGGGAGADTWKWLVLERMVPTGKFVEETVTIPVEPPTEPPTTETITRIKQPPEPILKEETYLGMERYWAGGGGGGGGAGLPHGKNGYRGFPTGIIDHPAGNWNGTKPSRLTTGDNGNLPGIGDAATSGLNISNLTSSGMKGDGGVGGAIRYGITIVQGGAGGDGGYYPSNMSGQNGQNTQGGYYGYPNKPSTDAGSPYEPDWAEGPESVEYGGSHGLAGYAVLCSQPWNNYPSTGHDASRVMGEFLEQQPKQRNQ